MTERVSYVACNPIGDYVAEDYAADVIACLGSSPRVLPKVGEVFPHYQYNRSDVIRLSTLDENFRSVIKNSYVAINRPGRVGPPASLVHIVQATVLRNVVYTGTGDDIRVVYETYRPNDRPYLGLTSGADQPPIAIKSDNRKFLFIGSAGSHNYGHWLVDDLPRLAAFRTMRRLFPADHIVVTLAGYSAEINAVRIEGIETALRGDLNFSIFFVDPKRSYSFESIFYCSPVTYHPTSKSPAALRQTRDQYVPTPAALGPPIFVIRKASRGRVLLNAQSLMRAVTDAGFKPIDPDGMNFADQVSTFAKAPAVVGVMGAAMTNTMFCRPGTKLIYLAPDGWPEPFYWDLAAVCGQPYQVCFGAAANTQGPRHLSDFTIDWLELRNALKKFALL